MPSIPAIASMIMTKRHTRGPMFLAIFDALGEEEEVAIFKALGEDEEEEGCEFYRGNWNKGARGEVLPG